MADFPALEVMTEGRHGLAVGTRLPLDELPFVIGRGKEATLRTSSGLVSRRHCEVVFEFERWWVRDLGTTHGTWHLGERVHDAELLDGDVFEVARSECFRLLLSEPNDPRDADMERAILERPDDEERWSVYADWLQEHGAPLGERIANPTPEGDLRWLGPLAALAGRGELHVDWAHGLPSRVTLRSLSTSRPDLGWEQRLATILRQPQLRFLRSLELDLGSFLRESPRVEWGARVLELLGADALPSLDRLAIGPGTPPPDVTALEAAITARRQHHPRFATSAARLFFPWRPATLTHDQHVFPLRSAGSFHVGPARSDLELPNCPALGVLFLEDRWRLTVESGREVKLNGLGCRSAQLRPGDVIEPTPGTRLLFDA